MSEPAPAPAPLEPAAAPGPAAGGAAAAEGAAASPAGHAAGGAAGAAAGSAAVQGGGELLRENIVAFAVAVVMALVIKHFCLEAFRIPTSSMYPTLYGERDARPDGQEDRILVDKWAYLARDPQRGEVVVFQYPLDRSRNFIKRVAGLPGEWVRIQDGDVWVRRDEGDPWRPAQRPRAVREALYRRAYPPAFPEETWQGGSWWEAEEGRDGWRLDSLSRLAYEGSAPARLRYAAPLNVQGGLSCRDLRLCMRVIPRGAGQLTLGWATEGGWKGSLVLPIGEPDSQSGGALSWQGSAAPVLQPLDVVLKPGRPTQLEWEVVDGAMHVWVDGVERAVHAFERTPGRGEGRQALTLEAAGAPLVLENLRIDTDLHYSIGAARFRTELGAPQGVRVPDDAYLMLGDNTDYSSDSRAWEAGGVRLKDGQEIWWNLSGEQGTGPSRVAGTQLNSCVDVDGIERTWHDEEEQESLPHRWITFVPRDHVVGRAFVIFWPAWPAFPRRVGWIH